MKIIGLLPVKNEAWVLPHAVRSLTAFCDVVIVADQNSDDGSREICRTFPNVVVIESAESRTCTRARWQLLDAARSYDGCNLLWSTDADELVSPPAAKTFLDQRRAELTPGTVVECRYVHLWGGFGRYRVFSVNYAPQWKALALVDDRRMDWNRANLLSLHEPRVPIDGAAATIQADVAVLHLQWLLPNRTQSRQAWYRCREWLDGRDAAGINERYHSRSRIGRSIARSRGPIAICSAGSRSVRRSTSSRSRSGTSRGCETSSCGRPDAARGPIARIGRRGRRARRVLRAASPPARGAACASERCPGRFSRY